MKYGQQKGARGTKGLIRIRVSERRGKRKKKKMMS